MPFNDSMGVDQVPVTFPVTDFSLDNGMRVVVNSDESAPGIALNLWYQVGSGDESAGATGFAHLFEHLMFAGSAQVASGEHLATIQALGGSANATTSFDRTNYFETVGPGGIEMACWLEAERMMSLNVNQVNLDTQREVVKEEKRQRYDNVPYGDQLRLLLELNFPEGHPYHHPAIGTMADLDAATLNDVQAFYQRWYSPAQAILTFCGAISEDHARRLAGEYFGSLPAHPVIDREPFPLLPAHQGIPELRVEDDLPASMAALCWRTPPIGHPDRHALDLALDVLGGSQSARLHQVLTREKRLAETTGAYDFGLARGNSLAVIPARASDGVETGRLIEAIVEILAELAQHGPSEAEVRRAKVNAERQWLFTLAPLEDRADYLSYAMAHFGDPERINTELAAINAVTSSDIQYAIAGYLAIDARACLRYEKRSA